MVARCSHEYGTGLAMAEMRNNLSAIGAGPAESAMQIQTHTSALHFLGIDENGHD